MVDDADNDVAIKSGVVLPPISEDIEALIRTSKKAVVPPKTDDYIESMIRGNRPFIDPVQEERLTPYEAVVLKHCLARLDRQRARTLIQNSKKGGATSLDNAINKLLVTDLLLSYKPDTHLNLVGVAIENNSISFKILVHYTAFCIENQLAAVLQQQKYKKSGFYPGLKEMCIHARISRLITGPIKAYSDGEYDPENLKALLVAGHIISGLEFFDGEKPLDIVDNFRENVRRIKASYHFYQMGTQDTDLMCLMEAKNCIDRGDFESARTMLDKTYDIGDGSIDRILMRLNVLQQSAGNDAAYQELCRHTAINCTNLAMIASKRVRLAYMAGNAFFIEKAKEEFANLFGYDKLEKFLTEQVISVEEKILREQGIVIDKDAVGYIAKLSTASTEMSPVNLSPYIKDIEQGKLDFGSLIDHMTASSGALVKGQIRGIELYLNGSRRIVGLGDAVRSEDFVKKIHEPFNWQKQVPYMLLELQLNDGGN